MKNGYQQFFKEAQKAAGTAKKPSMPSSSKRREPLKDAIKRIEKPKQSASRKVKIPWKISSICFLGVVLTYIGIFHLDEAESFISRIEFSILSGAHAESKAEVPAVPNEKEKKDNSEKAEVDAAAEKISAESESSEKKVYSDEELNHFARLNERKMELDKREEELSRAEAELAEQKAALEKRLSELDENRRQISSILEEKVKRDESKVDALVQVYSNMKPSQAAKVIETLDEDLAVEVLGKMKKKNAADILNLIKPEKAQLISEKYAGFRK